MQINNHLLDYFGNCTEIHDEDVQKFVFAKLDSGLKQKTVKDILMVLKMILDYGSRKGMFPSGKLDIRFPSEETRREMSVLSVGQQQKMMQAARENFDFSRRTLTVSRTIQRVSRADDPLHRTSLLMGNPKTGNSIREVPLPAELASLAEKLRGGLPGGTYVISSRPTPTEPRVYRSYFARFLKRNGLPPINYHGLRHSFATRCVESGCDYKTLSAILGHSNISTTLNLYVHPSMEQKRRCIEKMLVMFEE